MSIPNVELRKVERASILALAEKVRNYVRDGEPLQGLPQNVRIRGSSKMRADLRLMLKQDLEVWVCSHMLYMGGDVRSTLDNTQTLAEQIWNAIQNGTLENFKERAKNTENTLCQGSSDSGRSCRDERSRFETMGRNPRCTVPVGDGYRNKTQALALAEKVWDAKETGTLDNLKKFPDNPRKRKQAPWNSVEVPGVREDLSQMAKLNFAQNDKISRIAYQFKRQKMIDKKVAVALAERTWDDIRGGTLDDSKKSKRAPLKECQNSPRFGKT